MMRPHRSTTNFHPKLFGLFSRQPTLSMIVSLFVLLATGLCQVTFIPKLYAQDVPSTVRDDEATAKDPTAGDAQDAMDTTTTNRSAQIVVGQEQVITLGVILDPLHQQLADLVEVLLSEQGIPVVRKSYRDLTSLLVALENDELSLGIALPIDALLLHYQLPLNALPTDSERLSQLVENLADKRGVAWLNSTLFAEEYALFRVTPIPQPNDVNPLEAVSSISELAGIVQASSRFDVCIDNRFVSFWQKSVNALADNYSFMPEQLTAITLDSPYTAEELAKASCDLLFGPKSILTSGMANELLFALADPDLIFPPNHPALLVGKNTIVEWPEIVTEWQALVDALDAVRFAEWQALDVAHSTEMEADSSFATISTNLSDDQSMAAYQFLLRLGLVQRPSVTIGTRDETTQKILGTLIVDLLQNEGFSVNNQVGAFNGIDNIEKLEEGESDILIALLGEVLTVHIGLPLDALPTDLNDATVILREGHDDHGYTFLQPFDFSLTRVLLVDKDLAGLGINSLSRLADYMNRFASPLAICLDSDFYSNPVTGLEALEDFYNFHFEPKQIRLMDEDTIFTAIQEGQCQVTVGTITDGRIAAWNLSPLQDDKHFFPLNNPLLVVNQPFFVRTPHLATRIEEYVALLDTTTMQNLTMRVELGEDGIGNSGDEESVDQVAQAILAADDDSTTGLSVNAPEANPTSGFVTVGPLSDEALSDFTELPGLSTAERADQ